MRKARKVSLLKAVVMGTLFTSTSAGLVSQEGREERFADPLSLHAKLKKVKKGGVVKDFADDTKSKFFVKNNGEDREACRTVIASLANRAEKRAKRRRKLLETPYLINLSITPLNEVLRLLDNARKYSDKDPVMLRLNLHNVTEDQMHTILRDKNASHIGKLEWTYQGHRRGAVEQPASPVRKILDKVDKRLKRRRELLGRPYRIDCSGGIEPALELLRNARMYSDSINPIMVKLNLYNITKEQLNEILNDEDARYIDAQALEAENLPDEGYIHPGRDNLPQRALRKAARGRWEIEFDPELGNEGDFEPIRGVLEPTEKVVPIDIVSKNVSQKPKEDDNKIETVLPHWKITPLKAKEANIGNAVKENLGSFNKHAHQASQNLVKIYCRAVKRIG